MMLDNIQKKRPKIANAEVLEGASYKDPLTVPPLSSPPPSLTQLWPPLDSIRFVV